MVFKSIIKLAAGSLSKMFIERPASSDLCDADHELLIITKKTKNYLKHNFTYSGAFIWNKLEQLAP